jgi:amino acid permease
VKDISQDIWHYFFPLLDAPVYTILACIAVVSLPLTTQDTLHALRFSCYVGFASICMVLGCLVYKAATHSWKYPERLAGLRLGPESYLDVLTALPIVKLCFLCQFNMLGVYGNLRDPTDAHIDFTIRTALRIIRLNR